MPMSKKEPGSWDEALVAAGFTNRRSGKGASWTRLAEHIGVHTSTLTSMAGGTRHTDQAILDKVAEALRLDPRTVAGWVGRTRSERAPYEPPRDADLMDTEEREAVNRLISLLVKPKAGGTQDAGQAEAQKSWFELAALKAAPDERWDEDGPGE